MKPRKRRGVEDEAIVVQRVGDVHDDVLHGDALQRLKDSCCTCSSSDWSDHISLPVCMGSRGRDISRAPPPLTVLNSSFSLASGSIYTNNRYLAHYSVKTDTKSVLLLYCTQ